MPEKKWEIIAARKREKKQQRAREAGGVGVDHGEWKIFAECEVCGKSICVNNYADREVREPRFATLRVCPWCNPRSVRGPERKVRARTCNIIMLTKLLVTADKAGRKKIIAKLRSIHEDSAGG